MSLSRTVFLALSFGVLALSGCPEAPTANPKCSSTAECASGACVDGECRTQSCSTGADCGASGVCRDGSCTTATCASAADCQSGEGCVSGACSTADACAGRLCAAGQVCRQGVCGSVACTSGADCAASGESCSRKGLCVQGADPCADPAKCAAGQICRPDQGCVAVSCNTPSDCAPGETCEAGACRELLSCAANHADCDLDPQNGCEVDLSTDSAHCGGCATACEIAHGSPVCVAGACAIAQCTAPFMDCDGDPANGCEVDESSSTANCGGCGVACAPANGQGACVDSQCTVASCAAGFADCDGVATNGCEVDLTSSIDDCGACGAKCAPANSTGACVGGTCTIAACAMGRANCDAVASNGCEADLTNQVANCGSCGNPCPTPANGTAACVNATCGVGACNPGFADCDAQPANGCEIDTNTDPAHCGSCGQACAIPNATAACTGGSCAIGSCNAQFADCNASAADGCETSTLGNSNCGACGVICGTGTTCVGGFTAAFNAQPTDWNFNGTAFFDATAQSGVLTTNVGGQAGTIVLKKPIAIGAFTVTFDFRISQAKQYFPGDGMGFMLETNGPTAIGAGGKDLGMGGLTGYGVELDTNVSGGCAPFDSNANHVAVSQLNKCGGFIGHLFENAALPITLVGTGWHTAQIDFNAGVVTVKLDGTTVINAYAIPGFVNGTPYYLGFAASTGADWERHEIRNVTLTLPKGTCY